jgi:hypothetical protein
VNIKNQKSCYYFKTSICNEHKRVIAVVKLHCSSDIGSTEMMRLPAPQHRFRLEHAEQNLKFAGHIVDNNYFRTSDQQDGIRQQPL